MRRRYVVLIAGLIVLAAAGLGASNGDTKVNDRNAEQGGFLRIGDAGSRIDSINPFVSVNFFGAMTFRYNYPHLIQYNATNTKLVPDFARTFSSSADGRIWKYTLRAGAKWSDGRPLTSADVVWSINTTLKYAKGGSAVLAGLLPSVTSARANGPNEVSITYASQSASSQSLLAQFPILPKHIWSSRVGADGQGLRTSTNPAPLVSGGAYRLERYTPDQVLIFRRNPNYYGRRPNLDGFGLQFFSSQDALVSALRQKRIDVALEVPSLAVASLKRDRSVRVATPPGPGVVAVVVNANSLKPKNRELLLPRVRKAISLALDRTQLVDVVTDGQGTAVTTLVPPAIPQWTAHSKLPKWTRDVAAANKILDDLGYRRGSDGIRLVDGKRMEYDFNYCACYGERPQASIKSSLQDIGIEINVDAADPKAFIGAFSEPDGKWLNYDLGMFDDQAQPDPQSVLASQSCAQRGNSNFTYYCSQRYERMFAKQSTLLDENKRVALVVKMQQFIRENGAWLPMYSPAVPVAWRSNVRAFRPSGRIIDTLSSAQLTEVWIGK